MEYKRIKLPYGYDALEPFIDEETVNIHYNKHHKAYETKLNKAIEGTDIYDQYPTLESLMENYQSIEDANLKISIRQFGGGLINHNFM
jgi:Fe-Mn family superoxide dismutase